MNEHPLVKGKLYNIKIGTQTVPAKVTNINYRVNVNTLEHTQVEELELNAIADVVVEFDAPVVLTVIKIHVTQVHLFLLTV